jgi:hypothetical protein
VISLPPGSSCIPLLLPNLTLLMGKDQPSEGGEKVN